MSLATIDQAIARLQRLYNGDVGASLAGNSANLVLDAIKTHSSILSPVPTIPDLTYKDSPIQPTIEKGLLYGYAAVWKDSDGLAFIDGYNDETVEHSWDDTIREARETMRKTGKQYLMPHLFNHDRNAVIGGVTNLSTDSKGIQYQTKLAMKVPEAQKCYELARAGILGTSYGYTPVLTEQGVHPKTRQPIRRLLKIMVQELSAVVFPANPYSTAYAKTAPMFASGDTQSLLRLNRQASDLWAALASQVERSRR